MLQSKHIPHLSPFSLFFLFDKKCTYKVLLSHFGEDDMLQPENLFELLAKFATLLAGAHADIEIRKRRERYFAKRNARPPSQTANSPSIEVDPPQ